MTFDWWTFGLQTINVAILVWLLRRVFWQPVAATIAHRRAETERTLLEAAAARDQALAERADVAATRAGFAKERDAVLAAAQTEADKRSAALLANAKVRGEQLEAAARATIAKENQAAAAAWHDRSVRLAVAIATRLCARLDGPALHTAFLDGLTREIAALPDSTRQAMLAVGETPRLVSATALEPAERDRIKHAVAAAIGDAPALEFDTDPALIAGLELHGPHARVCNSWRADLARIETLLLADDETAVTDDAQPSLARAALP